MKHLFTYLFKLSHLLVRKKLCLPLPPLSIPLQNGINVFSATELQTLQRESKVPASVLDAVCTVYRGPEKLTRIWLKESSPACELGLGS